MVILHALMTLDDVSSVTRDILKRHIREGAHLTEELVSKLKTYRENNQLSTTENRNFSFAIAEISLRRASLLLQLSKFPFHEPNKNYAFDWKKTHRRVFFLIADNPYFTSDLKTNNHEFDIKTFLNDQIVR